jgi:hypothetical protein
MEACSCHRPVTVLSNRFQAPQNTNKDWLTRALQLLDSSAKMSSIPWTRDLVENWPFAAPVQAPYASSWVAS